MVEKKEENVKDCSGGQRATSSADLIDLA